MSYLFPADSVPHSPQARSSRFRAVCEEFLQSGEDQMELDWRAFAPGRTSFQVYRSFWSFFTDPERNATQGVAIARRRDRLYLIRKVK